MNGIIANKGKFVGKAAIERLLSFSDEKMVLVLSYSRPDIFVDIDRIGGIISENGGILTHAAILAREYDLPCIVGVKDATKNICNRDVVELDADTNNIRIVKNDI